MTGSESEQKWLGGQLEKLIKLAKRIENKNPPTNDYDAFTALKLITVLYYALPFARIVKKQKFASGAVYVDLFAVAGLVKIKNSKFEDFLPGSSICAASIKELDYVVCVEKNKKSVMF